MTRDEVIKEVNENPEYLRICGKILNWNSLYKDLYQELLLILLEYPKEKYGPIPNLNQLKFFIVGIICRMAHSNTSPFYYKYKRRPDYNELLFDEQNADDSKTKAIEKIIGITGWDGDNPVFDHKEKDWRVENYILGLYMQHGSFGKIAKSERVSRSYAHRSIVKIREKVMDKTKTVNILLITQNEDNGLKYHRQVAPHVRLAKTHPEIKFTNTKTENRIDGKKIEGSIDMMPDDILSEFDIVYYLRQISFQPGKVKETIDRCHRLGVKVVLDIDDYWRLGSDHLMYEHYKELRVVEETVSAIKQVDHVVTTTEIFAEKIRPLNPNVTILPNCINPDDTQFHPRDIESSRVRFGWIGGVYHKRDIDDIAENFCKLPKDKDVRDTYQICLGGYNTIIIQSGIIPNPEYHSIETSLTCNYHFRNFDQTYTEYLFKHTPTLEHISFDKDYRRLWAKDVYHYGELYNEIDVSLIPLLPSGFNRCKSELKIVEAGWMKKAVIVSDVEPYSKWIKNGVNGIKIVAGMNRIAWYLAIKKLIKEPNLRRDMAEALHQTIKDNFDMDKHNERRAQLYKSLA